MENHLIININRTRLLEAIVFFSKKLKYPTKMMLYKVLAELDFRHFKITGLPVTNLEYDAWEFGPVPSAFDKEISDRQNDSIEIPTDFSDSLDCEKEVWVNANGKNCKTFKFHAKRKPNLEVFTPRQKKLLEEILLIYKNTKPTTASQASHEKDTPWYKTVKQKGKGNKIDYFDLLEKDSKISIEESIEMIKEISAFQYNYQK